jgi:UPF0755 protein
MNRTGIILLALFVGAAMVCITAMGVVYHVMRPVDATGEIRKVTVEPGMTLTQVARALEQEKLIRNARYFRVLAQLRKMDHQLKVGRYTLSVGLSMNDLIDILASGRGGTEKVTIPEGLTVPEIAGLLQEKVKIDSTTFVQMAGDPRLMRGLGIDAPSLEGYLFPNTYYLYEGMRPELIIREMTGLFKRALTEEYRQRASLLGYSVHEIMTLASIIEQEAQISEERSVISGVFHNRLRDGIRLEADPTVQYAMGAPNARLLKKHLDYPSPYNTYVNSGLPPGPICSPGAASIRAALFPEEVPYLFFVARGDGSHIFSKSNSEHNIARMLVRQNRG